MWQGPATSLRGKLLTVVLVMATLALLAGGSAMVLYAHYVPAGELLYYVGVLSAIMVLSLLAAVLVSRWLQRSITAPIATVTSVARTVLATRDFTLRAPRTGNDETGLLVDAFNDMLDELGRRADALEQSNEQLGRQIAERMRAELELRTLNTELEDRVAARTSALAAANKDLESFSYSVSHDLRAPLRAISGFSNLLWEGHKDQFDEEAQRKLSIIRGQAERMEILIDGLLAFSRLARKAIEPVELNMGDLAKNAFRGLRNGVAVDAIEFHVGQLPFATADQGLLEQVWCHLLSNAIKFSSKKNRPVVEVGGIVEEDENLYYVRDNGAGFDPKYGDKVFGAFQRLHDESEFPGTGVGLALVHGIVTRHGGRTWADSQPGHGATFHFSLPREARHG